MFALDTNVCIEVLRGRSASLVERLRSHDPREIGIPSVVRAELVHGARRSRAVEANLLLVARLLEPFEPLPFDDVCAEHYGAIRADLERAGALLGANDMLIAATARAGDRTLVTHNVKEFRRVVSLRVADWQD